MCSINRYWIWDVVPIKRLSCLDSGCMGCQRPRCQYQCKLEAFKTLRKITNNNSSPIRSTWTPPRARLLIKYQDQRSGRVAEGLARSPPLYLHPQLPPLLRQLTLLRLKRPLHHLLHQPAQWPTMANVEGKFSFVCIRFNW